MSADKFQEKVQFEEMLIRSSIKPLTVIYHGSFFSTPKSSHDLDVVLILPDITPQIFKKLNTIVKSLTIHIGISLVSLRETGTIFGGIKYLDAIYRLIGSEERHPYAYYKIATLTESFRRYAIELNAKKCRNIAKIITKTINNFLGTRKSIALDNFDATVLSVERNLNFFYNREKIKKKRYQEYVRIIKK